MQRVNLLFFIIVFSVFSQSAWALRCSGKIIAPGDRPSRVIALCGEPADVREYEKEIVLHDRYRYGPFALVRKRFLVEAWSYNFGPRRLMQILTFHNGKLVDIETGPRGFRVP